jgi:hypothetical protein
VPDLKATKKSGCRGRGAGDRESGTRDFDNFRLEIERCLCGERIIMSVRKRELSERWKKGKGKTRSQGRPRVSREWAMGERLIQNHSRRFPFSSTKFPSRKATMAIEA